MNCRLRGTGKTSLIAKYLSGSFNEAYHPSLDWTIIQNVKFGDIEYKCSVIDTAGQVFSICSQRSFDIVREIYSNIINFTGETTVATVIVGCKEDLEQHRQVGSTEGQHWAERIGAQWLETSAKTGHNIEKVFEACLHEIKRHAELEVEFRYPIKAPVRSCIIM
ncbi:P-loop containing nucleoside triphosphate hydrolase protein [Favolaschia claudopus]|uniref:P-loop containing nucleoside triphosphate hydrolase protein n=1 Tax=Favolaschia claudopus TaxID=2862362 RepID=A0AAV9ZQI3_9AGAR